MSVAKGVQKTGFFWIQRAHARERVRKGEQEQETARESESERESQRETNSARDILRRVGDRD